MIPRLSQRFSVLGSNQTRRRRPNGDSRPRHSFTSTSALAICRFVQMQMWESAPAALADNGQLDTIYDQQDASWNRQDTSQNLNQRQPLQRSLATQTHPSPTFPPRQFGRRQLSLQSPRDRVGNRQRLVGRDHQLTHRWLMPVPWWSRKGILIFVGQPIVQVMAHRSRSSDRAPKLCSKAEHITPLVQLQLGGSSGG